MAASLNSCQFIGRIGKLETRYTASGVCCANVSLACDEKYKDKNGEWKEKCEWVNIVFWGKLGEIVSSHLDKGALIYASGRFTTRQWEDKDQKTRYSSEIVADKLVMLGGKGDKQQGQSQGSQQYEEPAFDPEQEIPF